MTLLAINDVYRIAGLDGGRLGGLARLRTLRAGLEAEDPDLLMLHAGDLLSPSLLSGRFYGAQMIDVMNLLDGDADTFDERLFVTFGNHEFDRGKMRHAPQLDLRLDESDFRWVSSNVRFVTGADGQPVISDEHLVDTWMIDAGGVRVGIFGVTLPFQVAEYIERYDDPIESARRATAELRAAGAELVIGLTHQSLDQDVHMVAELGDEGPDLVVGGHEHDRLEECVGGELVPVSRDAPADDASVDAAAVDDASWRACVDGVPIVKADADARTAAIWKITLPPRRASTSPGPVSLRYRWQSLDQSFEEDPRIVERVDEWTAWFGEAFCNDLKVPQAPDCLRQVIGRSRVPLVAEELEIRRFETNLGNFVTDVALGAWRRRAAADPEIPRADIAFVNSGSLRLNQNLAPGTIDRQQLEELFPFPAQTALVPLTGADLQKALERSISEWTSGGHFLQIAGFAFRHDPSKGVADRLTLLTDDGPRPIRPDDRLVAAVLAYLVDPTGGQDGYVMLDPKRVVPVEPIDLEKEVIRVLGSAEEGIAPQREGRICTVGFDQDDAPCLAVPGPADDSVTEGASR